MSNYVVGVGVILGIVVGGCSKKDEAKPAANSAPAEVQNLPYFGSTPVPEGAAPTTGPKVHHPEFVDPSYRLVSLGKQPAALLLAPDGTVAHRWQIDQSPVSELFADDLAQGWQNVELFPNGDLLALRLGMSLTRISPKSEILWSKPGTFHHESHIGTDGRIYALNETYRVTDPATRMAVLDSEILVLDDKGDPVGSPISIYEAIAAEPVLGARFRELQKLRYAGMLEAGPAATMEKKLAHSGSNSRVPNRMAERMRRILGNPEYRSALEEAWANGANQTRPHAETSMLLRSIPDSPVDALHANSVVPLPAHPKGLWQKGDYLVSLRELDTIAVISHQTKQVVWHWGAGILERQHEATLLPNGNILLFDNGTIRRWSRVLEVDPVSKTIAWSYGDNQSNKFLSLVEGGVHKLPNSNTLINITLDSRVIELTPDNQLVWEYHLPLNAAGTVQFTSYRCNSVTVEQAAIVLAAQ